MKGIKQPQVSSQIYIHFSTSTSNSIKMKVSFTSSSLVKPAKPTFNGVMQLADWDQIGYISHISTVHIYKPPNKQENSIAFINTLKNSLSRLLVHFYPIAGRLRWINGGRLELDCNAMGVQFIVAETKARLSDLGDFSTSSEMLSLAPSIDYENTSLEEHPLLYVQITKFQCGSISICPAMSHVIVDGRCASYFLAEWAKFARGESLDFLPFLDKRVLRAGEVLTKPPPPDFVPFVNPPILIGQKNANQEREKETMVAMLKLTKAQVDLLKHTAHQTRPDLDKAGRPYSRYETISGHIWRCASMARGHKAEQKTGLGISVDIRKRMQPPIPQNFFGNSTIDVVADASSGDLVSKPLGYAASRIRETIDKTDAKFVHHTIDFWKNQEDFTPFQDVHGCDDGPFYGNPNLGVTSWLTLPFLGLDFGWGKEVYMGPVTHDIDGDFILCPDNSGDGSVIVRGCLQVPHMKAFKKLFYDFS